MNEQAKTDITQRSYDKHHVLWAKLSAVRLGLEDKDQVKQVTSETTLHGYLSV